jgi:uncharacterized membrane-anchored protein
MLDRRKFWLAVALQVLLLLGLVGRHGFTVVSGQPVVLQSIPVDPWDFLRGEYVRLNYAISVLDPDEVAMTGAPYERGQAIWVVLAPGQPVWTAVAVHDRRPQVAPGQVALRGRVEYWNQAGTEQGTNAVVRYGVEQFYVPEGEGPKLEQASRDGKLTVQVLVDRFGRGAVHKVFADGQEVRWR